MFSGRESSRGQVLIIFVFAIIGLIAIAGLAIDGGNIYADRRQAQNAADTAALAGGLARANWMAAHPTQWSDCQNFHTSGIGSDPNPRLPANCNAVVTALNAAQTNGFNANGGAITVDVYSPPIDGYYATCSNGDCDPNDYLEVVVHHDVNTWFARVVGVAQTHTAAEAVALSVATHKDSPFPDAAIVGLDPNGTSFDAQSNSQRWKIKGGGIFANGNALDKHSNVDFLDGHCVTAVGTVSGPFLCGGSGGNTSMLIHYPTDVTPKLPPIPTCKGKATSSKAKVVSPDSNATKAATGSLWDKGFEGYTFAPGLYCMKSAGKETIQSDVTGTGVTFFMMDNFDIKFNGSKGSFAVTAPTSGTYAGVLMFSDVMAAGGSCKQNLEFRGNGTMPVVGTIFLPGACINWLGNSSAAAADTQLIGWQIYSNGTADANFTYHAGNNYEITYPGQVGLLH